MMGITYPIPGNQQKIMLSATVHLAWKRALRPGVRKLSDFISRIDSTPLALLRPLIFHRDNESVVTYAFALFSYNERTSVNKNTADKLWVSFTVNG